MLLEGRVVCCLSQLIVEPECFLVLPHQVLLVDLGAEHAAKLLVELAVPRLPLVPRPFTTQLALQGLHQGLNCA
jgi:hypothetical protein